MGRRGEAIVIGVAVVSALVSALVTAAVTAIPQLRFAAAQPELQGACEAAAAVIAVLAAILAAARLRRRCNRTDLALASALAVIALSNVFFDTVPDLAGLSASSVAVWSAIMGRSLGVVLFGVAAYVSARPLRRPGRAQALALVAIVGVLAGIFLFSEALAARLPSVVTVAAPAGMRLRPVLHAAPSLIPLDVATAVLTALAAAGYLGRFRRSGDEFSGWLGVAAVFAIAAQVNYILYPSLYAHVVSAGDAFRLCFYVVLFAGSVREVWSHWVALSDTRVASERRRIARDLHDGLAQELAYLSRNLDSLEGDVEVEALSRLRQAADRARQESRLAVRGLTVTAQPSGAEALADAVGEVARRFGLDLELDLVAGVHLPDARTAVLVRIACEAVVNAARHSGSGLVAVRLDREGKRIRMVVRDWGCGFDPSAHTAGFGLTSMRERAQSAGAVLTVSSRPGHGSQVEVVL